MRYFVMRDIMIIENLKNFMEEHEHEAIDTRGLEPYGLSLRL